MAKFFVKGNTTKVDAIKATTDYLKSIILDTEKKVIYLNNIKYGHSDDEVKNLAANSLKYFKSVSGNSGSAEAVEGGSDLPIKGSEGILTSVNANGVTITAPGFVPGTRKVLGNNGLTGGGPLTSDVTISHASASPTIATTGDYVSGITVDNYGHIATVTKADLPTYTLTTGTGDNGTVNFNGEDVAVKGLGSNAYTSTAFAPLASPTLTGTPKAPTAASGTNTTLIATTAFVQSAIDSKLAASDAMLYKGTLGTGGTITALPANHSKGDTYKVITNGTYAGVTCEIGDMIICLNDGTTNKDADWTVVLANIDGAVTGPASSTDAHVAVFDGTTGKVIKDSGFTIGVSVPANAKFTDTVYTHPTTAGNKHIPTGGAADQVLVYSSSGTAIWKICPKADKWTNSRTVTFGGGDVLGTFSIDGSEDVSNVTLSIDWEEL